MEKKSDFAKRRIAVARYIEQHSPYNKHISEINVHALADYARKNNFDTKNIPDEIIERFKTK